ncbi:uncharacterized protein C2845_PM08G05110 [Panicum miliaceum]|uniref:Uncharacterized protein n=1 Tax=Panicum miliaceum TaxID=4540 RepID=A0A3L6QXD3_PANMI|nr:uncharacterized protein C2845_PM08G05110 [Panicum miliaceum]
MKKKSHSFSYDDVDGPWPRPRSALSRARPGGAGDGFSVGLPLDGPPWAVVCVPAGMSGRNKPDVVVPRSCLPSSWSPFVGFTTAVGAWEDDHDEEPSPPASWNKCRLCDSP